MLIVDRLGGGGSFTELQALDFNDGVVEMGHDGPAHLAISDRRPLLRGLGVYHGKRGLGRLGRVRRQPRPGDHVRHRPAARRPVPLRRLAGRGRRRPAAADRQHHIAGRLRLRPRRMDRRLERDRLGTTGRSAWATCCRSCAPPPTCSTSSCSRSRTSDGASGQSQKTRLRAQRIELPSWAFGNSGTRFKVFAQAGVPRDPFEKIADAAQVHAFTGVAPSVALHIPWDKTDYAKLSLAAAEAGIALGTINANVFQDDDYMLGSVTNPDPASAAQGTRPSVRMRRRDGPDRLARSQALVLRRHELPRPGQHPGPPGPPGRGPGGGVRPADGDQRLILEYKLFEPAFYTMDVPDWGTVVRALPAARPARPRSASTPATTRRAPISSSSSPFLLRAGKLGAFDFNSRFYADDDLMVGSADPFQLFRILFEVVAAGGLRPTPRSRSCSTSATTSNRRSRARSGR